MRNNNYETLPEGESLIYNQGKNNVFQIDFEWVVVISRGLIKIEW